MCFLWSLGLLNGSKGKSNEIVEQCRVCKRPFPDLSRKEDFQPSVGCVPSQVGVERDGRGPSGAHPRRRHHSWGIICRYRTSADGPGWFWDTICVMQKHRTSIQVVCLHHTTTHCGFTLVNDIKPLTVLNCDRYYSRIFQLTSTKNLHEPFFPRFVPPVMHELK